MLRRVDMERLRHRRETYGARTEACFGLSYSEPHRDSCFGAAPREEGLQTADNAEYSPKTDKQKVVHTNALEEMVDLENIHSQQKTTSDNEKLY